MQKSDKERVVAELTDRLKEADTLIVADYRGLTNSQIEGLRGELVKHGARLSVVKNTLTRRAAEAAGADALLALLEGPTAIAFIEADGDAVAVAKALSDTARETKVLAVRGGIMQGKTIDSAAIEELSKLPPLDLLRGQVVAAILAPLNQLVGLINAPLRDFVGLIDARIEQLGGEAAEPPVRDSGPVEGDGGNREVPPATGEAAPDAPAAPEAAAEPEPEPEPLTESAPESGATEESGSEPQSPTADETLAVAAEVEAEGASGSEPLSPEAAEETPEEE